MTRWSGSGWDQMGSRSLETAGHIWRVPDAVARVCAQVRERAVLLRQGVLGRAQKVGFPMLGHGEGRGAVAFLHEGLHLLEGWVGRVDVLVERAEKVRVAPGRRAEVGECGGVGLTWPP